MLVVNTSGHKKVKKQGGWAEGHPPQKGAHGGAVVKDHRGPYGCPMCVPHTHRVAPACCGMWARVARRAPPLEPSLTEMSMTDENSTPPHMGQNWPSGGLKVTGDPGIAVPGIPLRKVEAHGSGSGNLTMLEISQLGDVQTPPNFVTPPWKSRVLNSRSHCCWRRGRTTGHGY